MRILTCTCSFRLARVEKSDWYASVEDPGNIDAHGLENNEEPAGESSRRNNIAATDQQDPKFSRFVQNVEGGSREGTPEGDPRLPGKRRLLGAMDDEVSRHLTTRPSGFSLSNLEDY